jgi:hypothetical protein
LLIFPDENHWINKPRNSLQWHREVYDWVARWTAPESAGQEHGEQDDPEGNPGD